MAETAESLAPRDECLNTTEFWSIDHARVVLEAWRVEYNTMRSICVALGYQTPEEFAVSRSAA